MPTDPRISILEWSPRMTKWKNDGEKNEGAERLAIDFQSVIPGQSLVIPLDLPHEPSLRVRVARENAKSKITGKWFRIIKHGAPHWCYEIGCIAEVGVHVGNNAPVPRETKTEANTPKGLPEGFTMPPPLDELGREIDHES